MALNHQPGEGYIYEILARLTDKQVNSLSNQLWDSFKVPDVIQMDSQHFSTSVY
jgi:hypothetical protein